MGVWEGGRRCGLPALWGTTLQRACAHSQAPLRAHRPPFPSRIQPRPPLTTPSGITPELLAGCRQRLRDAQRALLRHLGPATALVGHSLGADLRALRLAHGRCVDTAALFPLPRVRSLLAPRPCRAAGWRAPLARAAVGRHAAHMVPLCPCLPACLPRLPVAAVTRNRPPHTAAGPARHALAARPGQAAAGAAHPGRAGRARQRRGRRGGAAGGAGAWGRAGGRAGRCRGGCSGSRAGLLWAWAGG